MKRSLLLVAILTAIGVIVVPGITHGQAPPVLGPGDQGATLKTGPSDPGAVLKQPSLAAFNQPTYPNPLQDPFNPGAPQYPFGNQPSAQPTGPKFNHTDINKDVEVQLETGPWMVLVMTYSGETAPVQARKFVIEIREHHRLNAHVFNYGAKERRDEYERAIKEAEKQREALRRDGLTANVPLRLRVSHIPETTAVFIGGFVSREEAQRVLEQQIRKMQPRPEKVDLQLRYVGKEEIDKTGGLRADPGPKIKIADGGISYKNPFSSAMVVRNPCLPAGQSAASPEEEVRFMRKINAGEPLTLFNCKGKFTLAVKEFKTPVVMQENQQEAKGFLTAFSKKSEGIDYAANNAHTVAEGFRKAGLTDTYVLHTRYSSYVTVGSYDSPADANMLGMQRHLENYFRQEAFRPLTMYERPIPMEVPR